MLQLLVALSLSAQAEPVLVDRLQHVGHPPATVAAVCSPVSAVQERFGVTAELLSQLLVEHAPDKKNAAWLDLLDSERASALGLDGAGAVSVHWWEDGGTLLSLPLRTDLSDPQPLRPGHRAWPPGLEHSG